MNLKYATTLEHISEKQLNGFFVNWPNPPTSKTHLEILQNSSHIVLAIDENSKNVVGFINAISDNILSAYIPLLEVLPNFQNQGIGKELVTNMLAQLSKLYMIDVVCDSSVKPFYEKLGLRPLIGMVKRNYQNQNGCKI